MKKICLLIFLGLVSGKAQAAVTLNSLDFNLSPANGGAQTLISWSVSGPLISSQATADGTWTGIGALFDGAFNTSYFTDASNETYAVANAGTFTDLTASSSVQVNQIGIGAYGSSRYIVLEWGGSSFAQTGNLVNYTAGTDSYVINVPFTAFNPGTYTSSDTRLQGGMNFTTNVVPEPSALSLLAVGLGVVFRRSRKRD